MNRETITLAMGAGGKQTAELIREVFQDKLKNELFTENDGAILPELSGRPVMSTDGFIVSPPFFSGGNIGKLSVCGSINDVACMGARPRYLSAAFVLEEGFLVAKLEEIVSAMAETAGEAGVRVVCGDTKVAGKGQVDGCFITTTCLGEMVVQEAPAGARAEEGDAVIVTGDIGRHRAAILLARDAYGIEADITSDCAPLWKPVEALCQAGIPLHVIRDATRGGVGTVLYEIAHQSSVGVQLEREAIPVQPAVHGICDLLGLDPLYLACEGRLVVVVPESEAERTVEILRAFPDCTGAARIGKITGGNTGRVTLLTEIGTQTYLPEPGNELLPRIC